jgi:hypothetical protein
MKLMRSAALEFNYELQQIVFDRLSTFPAFWRGIRDAC